MNLEKVLVEWKFKDACSALDKLVFNIDKMSRKKIVIEYDLEEEFWEESVSFRINNIDMDKTDNVPLEVLELILNTVMWLINK